MEELQLNGIYYAVAIFAVFFHTALKFRDFVSKSPKQFNIGQLLKDWGWQKHLFFGFFSMIMAAVLVFTWDYWLEATFPLNELNAFFVGYFADSVFKNLKADKQKQLNVKDTGNISQN